MSATLNIDTLLASVAVSTAMSEGTLWSLRAVEREHIERVLTSVEGNKTEAARVLGIDRRTLYRKMDLHGMPRRRVLIAFQNDDRTRSERRSGVA